MAAWGRASARRFAREGATVFIAGRKRDRGESLASEINDAGGAAHFVELDIVNQHQWDAAIAQVKETAGALHVLMNIVGSNALVKFPDIDVGQWSHDCSRAQALSPRPSRSVGQCRAAPRGGSLTLGIAARVRRAASEPAGH
jgi:NAD(P)-dependent dehydrogenase (short-subunit alcohol dehydrogenase family)